MNTRHILPLLFLLLSTAVLPAQTPIEAIGVLSRLDQGTEMARDQEKNILLVFSGSDWCKPCILLKREVLHSAEFVQYAESNLVLVNLDFPALRKNKLSPEQEEYNASLAEKFNPEGKFPRILLLDSQGELIREVEYHSGMNGTAFLENLQYTKPIQP